MFELAQDQPRVFTQLLVNTRGWVLAGAVLLFGAASLAAALSSSGTAVIISRIVMGVGSSVILTGSIATLTLHYQDRRKARAFGPWSTVRRAAGG